MRSFLQLMSLVFLISCAGTPPYQSQKVKIWNGAPEEGGICRLSSLNLKNGIEDIIQRDMAVTLKQIKKIHQGTTGMECLSAKDEAFKQYACLTFEDLGVLYEYIETLINSCKKW